MTPWQKAEQWQDENDATADFAELLGWHLSNGLVFSTSNTFLLASEVRWNAEEQRFEQGEPNCWFVRIAAAIRPKDQKAKGLKDDAAAVREFMRVAPHAHRYAAWFRRNGFEPRVYCWEKLSKKVRL